MNIFVLDASPIQAARFHNDRHVPKMILESAQLLCTSHLMLDGEAAAKARVPLFLRPTHVNHPAAIWTRQTAGNYRWVYELMLSLLDEFNLRFDHPHTFSNYTDQLSKFPLNIEMLPQTAFPQCMPPQYRRSDAVEAYRLYYFHEKKHIAEWKSPRSKPDWWLKMEAKEQEKSA